jgi:hypothetical protein
MQKAMHAAFANKCKAQCEWAMSAVEQTGVLMKLGARRPSKVTITRISTGTIDDDGLVGALKWIRDGIAEALLFDDSEFSIAGQVPGKVPLFYAQQPPGKRGVRGVRIEIFW